jgi:hypothetical protein
VVTFNMVWLPPYNFFRPTLALWRSTASLGA